MKTFIKDFKAFAMKGNVVDLAVAVVIGAAFGKIVSSLVDTIITPFIGLFMGGVDFTSLAVGAFKYGAFIQAIIDFLIIALVIFIVIRMIGKLQKKEEEKEDKPKEPSEDVLLLREIRDALKR